MTSSGCTSSSSSVWISLPPMMAEKKSRQKVSANFRLRPVKTKRPFTPRDRHWTYNLNGPEEHDLNSCPRGIDSKISLPSVTRQSLQLEAGRKSSPESLSSSTTRLPAILEREHTLQGRHPKRKQFRAGSQTASERGQALAWANSNPWPTDEESSGSKRVAPSPPPTGPEIPGVVSRATKSGGSLSEIQDCLLRIAAASADDSLSLLEDLKLLSKILSLIKPDSQQRRSIYATLSPLVQHENGSVLIGVLDVLLRLKLSKTNLAMVAKILFHVTSSEKNDEELQSKGIIARFFYHISESCPIEDSDVITYGYGALKFVSFNKTIRNDLVHLGLVDVLILQLKIIEHHLQEKKGNSPPSLMLVNGVFQITACLRNALDASSGRSSFIELGGQALLTRLVEEFQADAEIMCNISRIFSLLSLCDGDGIIALQHDDKLIIGLLDLIERHQDRAELVVRLAFSLGNFAAKYEESRDVITCSSHLLMVLPNILEKYAQGVTRDEEGANQNPSGGPMDTAIKLIRVYANSSIDPAAGEKIALNETVVKTLLKLARHCRHQPSDELALPTLATLNNLTFYPVLLHGEIFEQVAPFVDRIYSESIALEAVRVLGNLSRHPDIRVRIRDDDHLSRAIMQWCGSCGGKLQFSALGILVNLMTDGEFRKLFRRRSGISLLIGQLNRIETTDDFALGSLICQCLWNYCIDEQKPAQLLGAKHTEALEKTLVSLLDTDDQGSTAGLTLQNDEHFVEFSSVGFYLLSKLCSDQEKSH